MLKEGLKALSIDDPIEARELYCSMQSLGTGLLVNDAQDSGFDESTTDFALNSCVLLSDLGQYIVPLVERKKYRKQLIKTQKHSFRTFRKGISPEKLEKWLQPRLLRVRSELMTLHRHLELLSGLLHRYDQQYLPIDHNLEWVPREHVLMNFGDSDIFTEGFQPSLRLMPELSVGEVAQLTQQRLNRALITVRAFTRSNDQLLGDRSNVTTRKVGQIYLNILDLLDTLNLLLVGRMREFVCSRLYQPLLNIAIEWLEVVLVLNGFILKNNRAS